MKAYLINKETKQVYQEYDNMKRFGENFIVTEVDGNEGICYCADNETYVDKLPEEENDMENYEELEPLIIEQDGELIANPDYES